MEIEEIDPHQDEESGDGLLSFGASLATDLLTGVTIPTPIKKNAFKAFNQLCTAIIDIPVAFLEGKAKEKRAETEARLKIISESSKQIVSKIKVDSVYADIATEKFGQRILREQINLDKISLVAAEQLKLSAAGKEDLTEKEETEIEDDWISQFAKEASTKSSEEMQLLFGRILAGEIQKPSSFSIKTLKILNELDQSTAKLFQILCSMSVSLTLGGKIMDARVVSFQGNAGSNSLRDFGLSFDNLNLLQEYNLIIPDYNCYFDYSFCIARDGQQIGAPFKYQGGHWALVPKDLNNVNGIPNELRFSGVAFSKTGKELLPIIDFLAMEDYTEKFFKFLDGKNFNIVPVEII